MGRDLPGREDVQYSVPRFYVDSIEQANLLEPDDVPEVPTDKRIDVGNRVSTHGSQQDQPSV